MTVTVRVWDPLVRVAHWGVALAVGIDLFNEAGANPWHRWIGYAALALVLVRLAWGLIGSPHARLHSMLRSAGTVRSYMTKGTRAPFEGHNPLGAVMAFTLWMLVIACAATGWALQLDRFWGDETAQAIHEICAYTLAGMVVVHVTGAVVTSMRQRTNLVKAMITGVKRMPRNTKGSADRA